MAKEKGESISGRVETDAPESDNKKGHRHLSGVIMSLRDAQSGAVLATALTDKETDNG